MEDLALTLELNPQSLGSTLRQSFFSKVQSYNFDELLLIVHTDGRFSPSERDKFECLFYKRYAKDLKEIDFKLVFM